MQIWGFFLGGGLTLHTHKMGFEPKNLPLTLSYGGKEE